MQYHLFSKTSFNCIIHYVVHIFYHDSINLLYTSVGKQLFFIFLCQLQTFQKVCILYDNPLESRISECYRSQSILNELKIRLGYAIRIDLIDGVAKLIFELKFN